MDKLTTTLLTGAAMTALSVAPAMAGHAPILGMPKMGQVPAKQVGLIVKMAHGYVVLPGGVHGKSNTITPKTHHYTYTDTLGSRTYSEPRSTWYKKTQDIHTGEVWYCETYKSSVSSLGRYVYNYNVHDCAGQKAKGSKDPNAKITVHSNTTLKQHFTYTYTYTKYKYVTSLTYYGPNYNLKNNTVSRDSFQFNDAYKYTYSYTSTCGKQIDKYDEIARLDFNLSFH